MIRIFIKKLLFLFLVPSLMWLLVSQATLFALLWYANAQRLAKRSKEFVAKDEEMRLDRAERLRQAREQLDQKQSDD